MREKVRDIIRNSSTLGWVMEPDAKMILKTYGLPVTRFEWARTEEDATGGARRIGYPVVAKIVSPDVVHKSDVGGVIVGIQTDEEMRDTFTRLSKIRGFDGVLVDEMSPGIEVIMGAKTDDQFGPVILVGIGGTSVEIYRDVAIRLAPMDDAAAREAIHSLRGKELLLGYRGERPVNIKSLSQLISGFSKAVMDMKDVIESIDLNPVLCNEKRAVVADARIMLK